MKKQALLVGLCVGVSAPDALAADWSAKSRLSQSVEASDNRALNPDPAGNTYLFTTQGRLDAIGVTATTSLELNADLNYQNLTGPGADQNSSPTDNNLGFKYDEKLSPVTSYNIAGYWQRQDATSAQLADTGIVIVSGDINTYMLNGGIVRQINASDELQWSTRGTYVDFSSVPDNNFTDVLTTGAWVRHLSASTQITTSLQLEYIGKDDLGNTQTVIGRLQAGLESLLMHDLTFKGTAGIGVQDTRQDASALIAPASTASGSDVDGLADLQLIYVPSATTQVTFAATHWTGPNVLGQIESRTLVGVTARQAINPMSNFWVGADYSGQFPIADIFDTGNGSYVRASVGYDYRLSPEWVAQLSYRFAHRNDNDGLINPNAIGSINTNILGSANSNTIFFSAVRETTILP